MIVESRNVEAAVNEVAASIPERVDLSAFDDKGFAVVRNFLTQEEITTILGYYREAQKRNQCDSFQINHACSAPTFALLHDKLQFMAKTVTDNTQSRVDVEQGAEYFSLSKQTGFSWRQNYKSFYRNQDHIDYVNLFIVILKGSVAATSLSVIPFDKLKAMNPACYSQVVGGGATRYETVNGKTQIYADEHGTRMGSLPFDLCVLAETPSLSTGDLLLMRGDLIHQAALKDSFVVGLSVRIGNSQTRLDLRRMISGSMAKLKVMMVYRRTFSRIFNAFQALDSMNATYAELIGKFYLDNSPVPSKFSFLMRILKLRISLMFRKS